MPVPVIDLLEIIHIQNEKTSADPVSSIFHLPQDLLAALKKLLPAVQPGKSVQSRLIIKINGILLIHGQYNDHQHRQRNHAKEKLDLKMHKIVGHLRRPCETIILHNSSDTVCKVDRHADRGNDHQHKQKIHLASAGSPVDIHLIHRLYVADKIPHIPGTAEKIRQQYDGIHDHNKKEIIRLKSLTQRIRHCVPHLGKKHAHKQIYTESMERPAGSSYQYDPRFGETAFFRQLIKDSDEEPEQRSGNNAHQDTGNRLSAHKRRENSISSAHIKCGSFPHGSQSKNSSCYRTFLRSQNTSGDQNRNIR